MKAHVIAAVVAIGMFASGCATIIEGTTQPLAVSSIPVQGAQCTLQNSQGTYLVTTPGTVTVHKTKTDMNVHCTRDGYQDFNMVQSSKFAATTAGNILAGGVVGLGVDAASGANYYYDSPVTVVLQPSPAATNTPAARNGAGL